jgi:hypothetical protein
VAQSGQCTEIHDKTFRHSRRHSPGPEVLVAAKQVGLWAEISPNVLTVLHEWQPPPQRRVVRNRSLLDVDFNGAFAVSTGGENGCINLQGRGDSHCIEGAPREQRSAVEHEAMAGGFCSETHDTDEAPIAIELCSTSPDEVADYLIDGHSGKARAAGEVFNRGMPTSPQRLECSPSHCHFIEREP